jgi:hypothetical protein
MNPRLADSDPAEDSGFLRAIKSVTQFPLEGKVKLSVTGCEILRHGELYYKY